MYLIFKNIVLGSDIHILSHLPMIDPNWVLALHSPLIFDWLHSPPLLYSLSSLIGSCWALVLALALALVLALALALTSASALTLVLALALTYV